MIAAPKSGSGKTVITCALLHALKKRGEKAVSYKCGPDYIDPMFHEKALGVSSFNLDTFFTDEKTTKGLFMKHALEGDTAVLEGVMGLYDGLGGIREEGSAYHLAKVTGTPIVLAVDVRGMGYSILPFLAGFLAYDTERLIKGVILNRISKGFFETIKPLIESRLPLSVPGFLTDEKEFQLESRHLGLVMPDELEDMRAKLTYMSEKFEETVSVPAILEIAEEAGELSGGDEDNCLPGKAPEAASLPGGVPEKKYPVIAVAKDEAFCFYYKDNLLMLEEKGAEIRYFSPLHDRKLPGDCSGLLLGGGYPELYAKQLSRNKDMRMAVKHAAEKGMPIVAECGGFMYLHSALTDKAGIKHAMAGVIPAECFDTGALVRFGYIEIQEKESGFFLPEGESIKAHEFHYYDSTDNGGCALAVKPGTGKSYSCVIADKNCWMGFPHLYYPSNPVFAEAFVRKARKYMELLFKKMPD